MNRRNRSRAVAAAWAEVREEEIQTRDAAAAHRRRSLAAGAQWTPQIVSQQIVSGWLEPVYEAAPAIALAMSADIRRGQRREKKIAVPVSLGVETTSRSLTTSHAARREYHFKPGPYLAPARTK